MAQPKGEARKLTETGAGFKLLAHSVALHVRDIKNLNGKLVETANNSENKGGKPVEEPEDEPDKSANEGRQRNGASSIAATPGAAAMWPLVDSLAHPS